MTQSLFKRSIKDTKLLIFIYYLELAPIIFIIISVNKFFYKICIIFNNFFKKLRYFCSIKYPHITK